eukprot:sb/3468966/
MFVDGFGVDAFFRTQIKVRVVHRVFSQNLVDERGVPPGPLERYRKFPILSRSLVMTVCQAFFLATLGYTSDKVIVNLTSRRDLKDGRGRHKPKHALPDSVKEEVLQHVQSIDWDVQGVKMSGKYEEFLQGHPVRVVRRVFSQNLVDEWGVPSGPLERYRTFPILSRSLFMTQGRNTKLWYPGYFLTLNTMQASISIQKEQIFRIGNFLYLSSENTARHSYFNLFKVVLKSFKLFNTTLNKLI